MDHSIYKVVHKVFYTAAKIVYLFSFVKYVKDAFSHSEKYKLVCHPPSHGYTIVTDFRVLIEIRIEKANKIKLVSENQIRKSFSLLKFF